MMPVAPDSAIEAALVHIVEKRLGAGDHELLTLKRVRATAEEELELPPDYLKNHSTWKERSKKIVTDEVVCFTFSPSLCDWTSIGKESPGLFTDHTLQQSAQVFVF